MAKPLAAPTCRLLMVADDFVAGGAFVVGERLARGLAGAYPITFACDVSPLNHAARRGLAGAGVEVVRLFAHAGDVRRARYDRDSARALLRRADPSRILFVDSSPRSNIAIKDVAGESGIPYVSIINFVDRQTPDSLRDFDADVERTANAAAAVVFVSAASRSEFEANFPGFAAPRQVVENGIPDEFFRPVEPETRAVLRRELGVGVDDVMLLLPGRLEPRKGQDLALAALARHRDAPRLRLVLAGFGDAIAEAAIEEHVRALQLEDQVCYVGPRGDLPRLLDACDIVLMPSRQEADPLVSKEAMAKGRPVIASDLPGVREQGHAAAFLVPVPCDGSETTVRALAAVIDDLRRDAVRRETVGRALRAIAERRFTLAQMVEAYRRILEAIPPRRGVDCQEIAALPLDRWLPVCPPHRAAALLKDGWSEFETDGIWSLGARARFALTLPTPVTHVEIACMIRAFAAPGRMRAFEVFANGRKVATWTFGRKVATWTFADNQRRIEIFRITSRFPKRVFIIQLRWTHPVSPSALGLSEDQRQLGLNLSALRIGVAAGAGWFLPLWAAAAFRRAATHVHRSLR